MLAISSSKLDKLTSSRQVSLFLYPKLHSSINPETGVKAVVLQCMSFAPLVISHSLLWYLGLMARVMA